MAIEINEKITVSAVFKGGKLLPHAFLWKNRKYKVEEVISSYTDYIGDTLRYHFILKANGSLYEICLDTKRMTCNLERVYTE